MERRHKPRIPVREPMQARIVAEGVDAFGRVLDLNNAGAFIETDLDLPKNTKLEIELRLRGIEKSLPLQALVARRSGAIEGRHRTIPAGLGIVFLAANVTERSFIQMAVLEALQESPSPLDTAQAAGASDSSILSENSSR